MKTLLIVDDDAPLLESLGMVFRNHYRVLTARSAEEAADVLERETADVMLLDVHLPGTSGVEYLHAVRSTHPHLPVILISGASSIRPLLHALDLGGVDYIRKPFEIDELRLVVARALRAGALRQRLDALEQDLTRRPEEAIPANLPMPKALEAFERHLIQKALQQSDGVQTRAAKKLGISRRILCYRISKLKIPSGQAPARKSARKSARD